MLITAVSKYYKLSPVDVEKWPFKRFARYQETMSINQEIERQGYDNPKPEPKSDIPVMKTKFYRSGK